MGISKKNIAFLVIFTVLIVVGCVVALRYKWDNRRNIDDNPKVLTDSSNKIAPKNIGEVAEQDKKDAIGGAAESLVKDSNAAPGLASVESAEELEEKQVSAFYDETDRWIDAKKSGSPSVEDVEHFHSSFRKLPKSRKNECLQRALNLLPDENVMLLVGILMDKTEDKKLVTKIYNDVLNRDEVVKKPILQTIFKDKEHPCWTDTAWILDVTGELQKKN